MELGEALARVVVAVERLSRLAAERSLPKALTLREAAAQLSVSGKTLARMAKEGEVRTVTLGRRVLVPVSELERLLAPKQEPPRRKAAPVRGAPAGGNEAAALRSALKRR